MQKMTYLCDGIASRWCKRPIELRETQQQLSAFLELEITRAVAEAMREVKETARNNITKLLGL